MTPKIESRMYADSAGSINFFVGCDFDCAYCRPSFQRQMKRWGKNNCQDCYDYKPHAHLERLDRSPPKVEDGQFIFFPSAGDWSMIPTSAGLSGIDYMKKYPDRLFLSQTKNPNTFERFDFPENAILGITLETDDDIQLLGISKAPPPWLRFVDFYRTNHVRKMVTVEPIIDFQPRRLRDWIVYLKPWRVYIGYDSHPNENHLPEPPLSKTLKLVKSLQRAGIDVRTKLLRREYPRV